MLSIIIVFVFMGCNNNKDTKTRDNHKATRELIKNSYSKIKLSNSIVMDNIISEYGAKYDELEMYRINKELDISITGIKDGKTDIDIYHNPNIKLEYLYNFFYNREKRTISYNTYDNPFNKYRLVYYIDKSKIPSECLSCDLILQDSSSRYIEDFRCKLDENWVIFRR